MGRSGMNAGGGGGDRSAGGGNGSGRSGGTGGPAGAGRTSGGGARPSGAGKTSGGGARPAAGRPAAGGARPAAGRPAGGAHPAAGRPAGAHPAPAPHGPARKRRRPFVRPMPFGLVSRYATDYLVCTAVLAALERLYQGYGTVEDEARCTDFFGRRLLPAEYYDCYIWMQEYMRECW